MKEADGTWKEIERRFGQIEVPVVRHALVVSRFANSIVAPDLTQPEELSENCDEMLRLLREEDVGPLLIVVASHLFSDMGAELLKRDMPEQALVVCDRMAERFETINVPGVVRQVAIALFNRGAALAKLNRLEQALATWESIVEQFRDHDDATISATVNRSLVNKGLILARDHPEEAVMVWGEVLQRLEDSDAPTMIQWFAISLVEKGLTLTETNRLEENSNSARGGYRALRKER